MRAFAVCLLTIGGLAVLGVRAAESNVAKPSCSNGLLAFSSNRSEDALGEIYRIGLDGTRTDVSRSVGADHGAAPSPDGSKVAFWSSVDGLVVADADGQNKRRLVASGTVNSEGAIDWAPDSRRLAITGGVSSRASSGTVVLVYDTHTGVGSVLGFGSDPHFSPDGTLLEYASSGANGNQALFVARPDGTDRRQIAYGSFAAWSPDGTRVLGYLGSDSWVASVGGEATITIPSFVAQAWTPDGSRLIGMRGDLPAGGALETVTVDGSDPWVVAEGVLAARLSPDGRRVVFVRESDRHVVVTGLDGHVLADFGSWNPGPYDLHMRFQPSWSPDGTKIVYWSGGKVIVAEPDTGKLYALAGGAKETVGAQPVWSSDSSVFADITDATGNTDIYVARPDGRSARALFADRLPEGGPIWSPGGRRLAFVRYGSPPSLVVTDLTGHARVLTNLPPLSLAAGLGPSLPAWSPDGKTIAVASSKGVLLVDVRTRTVRRWPTPVGEAVPVAVAWSRQGAIATTDGLDDSSIWIAGKRSTWKVGVGDFYDPNYGYVTGLATNLAWSPDGNELAFVRYGAENGTGYFAWVVDSMRLIDTSTRRTRPGRIYSSGFSWSPDGRYLIVGGFDAEILTLSGKHVAWLRGLRATSPAWQPLCR